MEKICPSGRVSNIESRLFASVALVLVLGLFSCRSKPAERPAPVNIAKTPKWKLKVAEPEKHYFHKIIWQTPAVGDDGAVYEGGNGLYAVAPDGSLRWKYGDSPLLAPLIDDQGVLWVGSPLGWMARVETYTGRGSPIVGGLGEINQIALSRDGAKLFLSGSSMFLVRAQEDPLNGPQEDSPSGLRGLAVTADGSTYRIDRDSLFMYSADDSVRWAQRNFYMCNAPSLDEAGNVYLGCADRVTSYAPDGSWRWSFQVDKASSVSIAGDGTVYFSSGDKNTYALAPDGHKKWQVASGMSGHSTPAISQSGTIYVGSGDGKLYALNPDGSEKWESATGGEVYSPTIANDGTVYAHSGDGNIYAFSDENGGLAGQWPKLNADLHNTARSAHRR